MHLPSLLVNEPLSPPPRDPVQVRRLPELAVAERHELAGDGEFVPLFVLADDEGQATATHHQAERDDEGETSISGSFLRNGIHDGGFLEMEREPFLQVKRCQILKPRIRVSGLKSDVGFFGILQSGVSCHADRPCPDIYCNFMHLWHLL